MDPAKCKTTQDQGMEDVEMGRCLKNVGVTDGDSRDNLGRSRFKILSLSVDRFVNWDLWWPGSCPSPPAPTSGCGAGTPPGSGTGATSSTRSSPWVRTPSIIVIHCYLSPDFREWVAAVTWPSLFTTLTPSGCRCWSTSSTTSDLTGIISTQRRGCPPATEPRGRVLRTY